MTGEIKRCSRVLIPVPLTCQRSEFEPRCCKVCLNSGVSMDLLARAGYPCSIRRSKMRICGDSKRVYTKHSEKWTTIAYAHAPFTGFYLGDVLLRIMKESNRKIVITL